MTLNKSLDVVTFENITYHELRHNTLYLITVIDCFFVQMIIMCEQTNLFLQMKADKNVCHCQINMQPRKVQRMMQKHSYTCGSAMILIKFHFQFCS